MNYLMILIIQMMNKYMLKISFILINFILFKIYKKYLFDLLSYNYIYL